MAEAPESEPVPSSSEIAIECDAKEDEGPLLKKRKIADKETTEKLEHRLGGILCCTVCLDLPPAAVYQCSNGHLMCAPCFNHLLADARLRDESATCPNCRVDISKSLASRNLAVEKTVSELPLECKFCTQLFPRHSLQHHEEKTCEDRDYKFGQIVVSAPVRRRYLDSLVRIAAAVYALCAGALRRAYLVSAPAPPPGRRLYRRLTGCRFECIGCPWRGPAHEAGAHEAACAHPRKPAAEVVEVLAERERRLKEHNSVYNQVLDLLSYEKITFNEVSCTEFRNDGVTCGAHRLKGDSYSQANQFEMALYDHMFKESEGPRGLPRALDRKAQLQQSANTFDVNSAAFIDLQLKPYRTEEYVHKLYYETSRFTAFGHQWVVKAFVNKNQRDPTQSSEREITYQIILKSKPACALPLQWVWLRGPYGDAACAARAVAHAFGDDAPDSPPLPLPLADPAAANRLLLNKAIQFRLIMFLAQK